MCRRENPCTSVRVTLRGPYSAPTERIEYRTNVIVDALHNGATADARGYTDKGSNDGPRNYAEVRRLSGQGITERCTEQGSDDRAAGHAVRVIIAWTWVCGKAPNGASSNAIEHPMRRTPNSFCQRFHRVTPCPSGKPDGLSLR